MKGPKTPRRPSGGPGRTLDRLFATIGTINVALIGGGALAILIGLLLFIFFHEMRTFAYVIMALGGVAILVTSLVSYQQVIPLLLGRRSRFGANTLIMTAIFLGIAMLVNYLAYNNNSRVDVTAAKQFTLAPRTVEFLKDLEKEDVKIRATAFFRGSDATQTATRASVDDLLYEFDRRSGNFSYRFIDPDVDPITAKEYAVTRYQVVVFENMNDGRRQTIATPPVLEEQFVTALLIAWGKQQKRVYMLVGHGERNVFDETGEGGYWQAYNGLFNDNYLPVTLNLLDQQTVPSDAAAVIVAGPKKDLVEGEEQALEEYLLKGGSLFLLLDPETPSSIRNFVKRWGIQVSEGRVIDLSSSVGGNPKIPLLQKQQFTTNIPELSDVLDTAFFPEVSALKPAKDKQEDMPTINYAVIGSTTSNSWLVNDPAQDRPIAGDEQGPFTVAAAVIAAGPIEPLSEDMGRSTDIASIIVIGDSDFAANRYYYAFSNSDLFLDSVNWLTKDYAFSRIRPKPVAFRDLVLTTRERDFFRYSTWFVLPITMLGLAAFVWWRRR